MRRNLKSITTATQKIVRKMKLEPQKAQMSKETLDLIEKRKEIRETDFRNTQGERI